MLGAEASARRAPEQSALTQGPVSSGRNREAFPSDRSVPALCKELGLSLLGTDPIQSGDWALVYSSVSLWVSCLGPQSFQEGSLLDPFPKRVLDS